MHPRRAQVLLAGVMMFMTSGADAALPALLRLAQLDPCPRCSMQGCRCGAGCCDTQRCRRPANRHAAVEQASMSPREVVAAENIERSAGKSGVRDGGGATGGRHSTIPTGTPPAISHGCSGADRDALPAAAGGHPALIASWVGLAPPGAAGCRTEPPAVRPAAVLHEPPIPPPRCLA